MSKPAAILFSLLAVSSALASDIRVPEDHENIQAAIDNATPGDLVSVAPGRYRERIRLQPGVTVRSRDDADEAGKIGVRRAEMTILDGGGEQGDNPGVLMAAGSTLDGFTITGVGVYDEETWQKHFETRGENLPDEEGSVQEGSTVAAVSIPAIDCTVTNNIVHHNGDVGISVVGSPDQQSIPLICDNVVYRNLGGGIGAADHAAPIIRSNTCYENLPAGIGCRNSNPLIIENICHGNIRAGIGCREGARPVIRGNECYRNRRAGIGIRMDETAPVVEDNECYENGMAGIGCRDGARPVIRNNHCHHNQMAGIGCDGGRPTIIGNHCRENEMAGIGLRGAATAVIHGNRCIENQLVAIGVTAGSTADIADNKLLRTGGRPPLIAIKDGSTATVSKNHIEGGGVAAILVQGAATIRQNTLASEQERQGKAVWVWEGSQANISSNDFHGYDSAVTAAKSKITITDNTIADFGRTAIIVADSSHPAHIYSNTATSEDRDAQVVKINGPAGVIAENVLTVQGAPRVEVP